MFSIVMMALATIAADDATYAVRKNIAEGTSVTTPREAVSLALADVESLNEHDQRLVRYVWVPDWIEAASAFGQVALVANSTFSRTSNVIQPTPIAEGKLLRLELVKFASSAEQVTEIINLYELLRAADNYFNVEVLLTPNQAIVVTPPVAATRGQATAAKPAPPQPKTVFAAAAYLFPEGARLFELTHSAVPIMRLDEWVAFAFSSVNGGQYYQLTGIEKTLEKTIEKFAGKEAAEKVIKASDALRRAAAEASRTKEPVAQIVSRLDPDLAKTKAYIQASAVTGRQRIVMLVYGTATAPASGPQLVAVTFDIGEDNVDPNNDPLRGPTAYEKYDGGEAIFALPNGMLAYLVFNAKDETIASVPDNVAHDFAARSVRGNVATTRVFAGVSCANCHDRKASNWGWQDLSNDLYGGLSQLIDDRQQPDTIRANQIAASQFGANNADLKNVLSLARLSYQFRAQLGTKHNTTRETVAGLADSYWGYWYDAVTPQVAALELGQMLAPPAAQLFLLRAIEPQAEKAGFLLREDAVLARLKDGKSVAPTQWRSGYQSFAERTHFHQEKQQEN
jgi:hypothetical protein